MSTNGVGHAPSAELLNDMDKVEYDLDRPCRGWLGPLRFFVCTVLPWGLVLALSWLLSHPGHCLFVADFQLPYSVARLSPSYSNDSILGIAPSTPNAAVPTINASVPLSCPVVECPACQACPAVPACPALPPPPPIVQASLTSSPPPAAAAAVPVVCPSLTYDAFIPKFKDGVWTKTQYDSWLAQKPGDDPKQSPTYPYNSDYSIAADAPMEAGGKLSISQVQVVLLTAAVFHRTRGDIVMASWGQAIPAGHLYMYTDGPDDEHRLPIVHFPHTPGRPNASELIPGSEPPQYTHPLGQYYSLAGGDSYSGYVRGMIRWLQGMQHAFPLVVADPSVKWLLFADDDTFVYWPHILRLCAQYNSSELHSLADIMPDRKAHIAGGAGWIISRAVVERMVDRVHECYGYYWKACEDLRCIFYDVQITRCYSDLLSLQHEQRYEMEEAPPSEFTTHPGITHSPAYIFQRRNGQVRGATFHYIKGQDMLALHNIAVTLGGR